MESRGGNRPSPKMTPLPWPPGPPLDALVIIRCLFVQEIFRRFEDVWEINQVITTFFPILLKIKDILRGYILKATSKVYPNRLKTLNCSRSNYFPKWRVQF